MKKIFYLFIVAALVLGACKNDKKKTESQSSTETTKQPNATDTPQVSKSTIDWQGTYIGTLPCADCEGILTTVELNHENTYKMTQKYLGHHDEFFHNGNFRWNNDETIITIKNGKTIYKFLLKEKAIAMLSKDEKEVTGELAEDYILKKQETKTE